MKVSNTIKQSFLDMKNLFVFDYVNAGLPLFAISKDVSERLFLFYSITENDYLVMSISKKEIKDLLFKNEVRKFLLSHKEDFQVAFLNKETKTCSINKYLKVHSCQFEDLLPVLDFPISYDYIHKLRLKELKAQLQGVLNKETGSRPEKKVCTYCHDRHGNELSYKDFIFHFTSDYVDSLQTEECMFHVSFCPWCGRKLIDPNPNWSHFQF